MTQLQTRINPPAPQWDAFVTNHPRAHFLQLAGWAILKSNYGWRWQRVALTDADDTILAGAQILFRDLPLNLTSIAYIPFGLYMTHDDQWQPLLQAIDKTCKQNRAFLLKWEAGYYHHQPMPDFAALGFQPSTQTIQPPRTIMLDITADDDTIQSRMNQSTRRNIRKAYKNDIRYYQATRADLPKFTQMMQVTGNRNEFGVHSPDYYEMMYDLFVPQHAALILADHEGDTLAGNFVFQAGDTAVYLSGASSNTKRNLMASYGVQWEAIQWAQQRGCTYYDMWGVPDEDADTLEAQFKERNDDLWGVYRFKRGWGGEVIRSAGTWDKIYNPLINRFYNRVLNSRR